MCWKGMRCNIFSFLNRMIYRFAKKVSIHRKLLRTSKKLINIDLKLAGHLRICALRMVTNMQWNVNKFREAESFPLSMQLTKLFSLRAKAGLNLILAFNYIFSSIATAINFDSSYFLVAKTQLFDKIGFISFHSINYMLSMSSD